MIKISLLTESACSNPATKFSADNLLNPWAVIYLELSGILFLTSLIFVFKTAVVTKPLVSRSLIFFSRFFLPVLYWFMWIKVVSSGNCFSYILVLNSVFLTTSLSTTSLHFFTSTVTVFNLKTSKSSTFIFILFKLVRTLTSSLMSSLSISDFKVMKSF